jgi:hypothetical protein
VDAELRKGEPTIIRAFRLLYTVALAILQPLPCLPRSGSIIGGIYGDILIVVKEGEGGESRPSGRDCQRKNADFDKRGEGVCLRYNLRQISGFCKSNRLPRADAPGK